jgi:hypothetical protein
MLGFKGFTCDKREVQRTTDCPNQDIIDKVLNNIDNIANFGMLMYPLYSAN